MEGSLLLPQALGLGKLALVASEEQIKAAYKRLVVETHPDKTKVALWERHREHWPGSVQDGDDRRFKAVQKAYEVLSDPLKKVAYDSSRPFDDEIPQSKACGPPFGLAFCSQGGVGSACFNLGHYWVQAYFKDPGWWPPTQTF